MNSWESFFDLVSNRRSVRRFQDKSVEEEKILKMLEALRLAPSSSNSQPWHVVVVRNKANIEALAHAAPIGSRFVISWMSKAPLVFVLLLERKLTHRIAGTFGHANLWLDAGIAGEHLVLAAQALGLGTCWIGWFDSRKVLKILNAPSSYQAAALIACGYPAEKPDARKRKNLSEIHTKEMFQV